MTTEPPIDPPAIVIKVTTAAGNDIVVELKLRNRDRLDVRTTGPILGSIKAATLAAWLSQPTIHIDIQDGDVAFAYIDGLIRITTPDVARFPLTEQVVRAIYRYLTENGVITDDPPW